MRSDHVQEGEETSVAICAAGNDVQLFTAPATLGSSGAGCGWGRGLCCQALRPSSDLSTWSRASARS
eukprot:CAMPEP_0185488374 /NCGR_PEP_ID=MMETSP1366-20130426/12337_1 /TAXON_ID=38817 /ORGANISM="Gephyrocapsa oceanica, Strain RCC1303" /LENGTH=66 /DNA_ID=CAMNT_0028096821 /DNA_START=277 /DNA_END=474 /DNA_ORIENTATION=-